MNYKKELDKIFADAGGKFSKEAVNRHIELYKRTPEGQDKEFIGYAFEAWLTTGDIEQFGYVVEQMEKAGISD